MNTTIDRPIEEISPQIIEQIEAPQDAVLERLLLGRERVKKGWWQGGTCANGPDDTCAANAVLDDELGPVWSGAILALQAALGAGDRLNPAAIMNFNDHPSTTQEDVVALFTKAIEARMGAV